MLDGKVLTKDEFFGDATVLENGASASTGRMTDQPKGARLVRVRVGAFVRIDNSITIDKTLASFASRDVFVRVDDSVTVIHDCCGTPVGFRRPRDGWGH